MASDVQCALTHAVQALARRQRLSHAVRIFAFACLVISIGMYFVDWGQLSYGLLLAATLPFLKQIPDRDIGRMVDETGQFTGAVECALDNRHRGKCGTGSTRTCPRCFEEQACERLCAPTVFCLVLTCLLLATCGLD